MWMDACLPFWKLRAYLNARRPRHALLKRKQRLFSKLAAFAAQRSPYYAELVRRHNIDLSQATPEQFPPLTKAALLEHFDRIVTEPTLCRRRLEDFLARSRDPAELLDGRYVVIHSSGTSGQPVICPYTLREWVRGWTKLLCVAPINGPVPRRAAFVGAAGGHFATVTLVQTARWLAIGRLYRTRLFDINMPWGRIVDGMNHFQPHNLACYSSILGQLALEQERGALRIRPRTILCGGDALAASDRRRAERVFRRPVFEAYGTTETSVLGLVEPRSDGMVLLEDDLWIEIEADRLLVTHLANRTMPLIRYVVSDTVVPSPQTNFARYRGYRRIQSIAGRREDNLVLRNEHGAEDFIHPLLIVEFYVPGIDRFQIRRTSEASFTFRVQPQGDLSPIQRQRLAVEVRKRWSELLAQKGMRNVRFDVELVDELLGDPKTGKFRLVVSSSVDDAARHAA